MLKRAFMRLAEEAGCLIIGDWLFGESANECWQVTANNVTYYRINQGVLVALKTRKIEDVMAYAWGLQ